jgi:tetratricopeptide (TPR) repeat protein
MATNRLETLKSMVALDPASAFARYGLAIEYANTGQEEAAAAEFDELLKHNPDYAAGYFHAGRVLEKLGRVEEAKAAYERGIECTNRIGDAHTRSELQAALDLLSI